MSERVSIKCDGCGKEAQAVLGHPHPAEGWLVFRVSLQPGIPPVVGPGPVELFHACTTECAPKATEYAFEALSSKK